MLFGTFVGVAHFIIKIINYRLDHTHSSFYLSSFCSFFSLAARIVLSPKNYHLTALKFWSNSIIKGIPVGTWNLLICSKLNPKRMLVQALKLLPWHTISNFLPSCNYFWIYDSYSLLTRSITSFKCSVDGSKSGSTSLYLLSWMGWRESSVNSFGGAI